MKHIKFNSRANAVLIFSGIVFVVFIAILFNAQIFDRTEYLSSAATKQYSIETGSVRGIITDRNGNTLVYNEQVNMLVLNALTFPSSNDEQNEELLALVNYLESQGEEWINNLPIWYDEEGKLAYREEKSHELKYFRGVNMLDVNDYASAEDCLTVLKEKFNLESYTDEAALKVASIRYGMSKGDFSANNPYTVSKNVSTRTIAYLKENNDVFRGIDTQISTERKYIGDGTLACHVLGVTGSISAEEYSEKTAATEKIINDPESTAAEKKTAKLRAYDYTDIIGKDGIELAAEEYLRGTKGEKNVSVDSQGILSESYSVVPTPGNTVQLTLDMGMQEVAESSLAKQISAVTNSDAIAQGMTAAGAVVVLNVNDASVLAMAAYPNYSLSTYYDNYSSLATDASTPLWNRAAQSTYSPGSTMKPVIAIAALEEGIIEPDSYITCRGTYEYIDQVFACNNQTIHGVINVKTALQESCNIFFFEMARQLGIDTMNRYSELFGLAQKTGIEISESKGILAGIKNRESRGLGWKAGETLLAAIGQSDNSFTILQLANYTATIANGGTRYTPHLINKVLSADNHTVIYKHEPQIACETNVSKTTLEAVKQGMYLVANNGSCAPYFRNLKYTVACKTGTAEKSKIINGNIVNGTDGFLITFGPYENSEIAICVVIENAGSGASTAQVAADIYNYYFSNMNSGSTSQSDNTITW